MEYQIKLGLVIKELRIRRKLTQARLSGYCHLSEKYISQLERGQRRPSLTTLLKLSIALDVPPSQLLSRVDHRVSWRYLASFSLNHKLLNPKPQFLASQSPKPGHRG